MNKEEMICKNCKYHYIEEISFDYPQSCCGKRKAVIEEWFNCNDFEYCDRYIKQLQRENKKIKKQREETNEMIKKCGFVNIEQVMLSYCGLIAQQKEFIKWLENGIEKTKNTEFLDERIQRAGLIAYNRCLQKYKEIT